MRKRKIPIYGNYKVLSPEGKLMFRCQEKKFNWYLKRNLAKIIEDSTIQLLFEPKGLGHQSDYYLKQKDNICVVCGFSDELNLTKHHVVPYCYRKFFPPEYKDHNHHDILPLCLECHNRYECLASNFKQKISNKYNIPINGICSFDKEKYKAIKYASSLFNYENLMNNERKDKLKKYLSEYLKKECTDQDIKNLSSEYYELTKCQTTNGELVFQKIDNLNDFIIQWRKHFIENMHPKFLPEGWKIN